MNRNSNNTCFSFFEGMILSRDKLSAYSMLWPLRLKDRGTVYMGCKNGQREVVEDGDSFSLRKISGKKNYFRDSYFYNGVGYTVHSGSIYLSR